MNALLGGKLIITPLLKAKKNLDDALLEVHSTLTRDGAIQRFEYCFELAWKTMKRILKYKGSLVEQPRDVMREAAKEGWIQDPQKWFFFLELRNKSSHIYEEKVAEEVFSALGDFQKELDLFLKKIMTLK